MTRIAVLIAVALAGCSGAMETEAVYLERNGTSGVERVQCGPYSRMNMGGPGAEDRDLRQCVSDYQQAGYQRVMGPTAP